MILIVLLIAVAGPRFGLVLAWLFTDSVADAFSGPIIPIAGFLFAPWTTLAFIVVWSPSGPTLIDWLIVAVAAMADLGSYGGSWLRFGPEPALA